jgi:hypothetical protein
MTGGIVNFAVTSGEGGQTLYISVLDFATGNPITQGVCLTGQYNTSPEQKSWDGQVLCSSGEGQPMSLFTDKTGVASWGIPFTCPSQVNLLLQTPGYEDLSVTFGMGDITGPVNAQFSMAKGTMGSLGQAPPQCLGMWADLNQASMNTTQTASAAAGQTGAFVGSLGLYAVVGVALVAVVLIVFAVLMAETKHP